MDPVYSVVTLFILTVSAQVNSAKILAMIPVGTKSHTMGFEPLYHELANRGHNVTILTNYAPSKSVIPNVRYVQNFDSRQLQPVFENPFLQRLRGESLNLFALTHMYEMLSKGTYENPAVRSLLDEDFDLIIVNSFMSECVYGLVSQFPNAKLMFFSTLPLVAHVSSIFGNPVVPSFTPLFLKPYSDRMTFPQRILNFVQTLHHYYLLHYRHVPRMEASYREFFPNAPSAEEVEKRVDLILINSHPIVNYPRALLPNMIETSGLQCKDGGKLPQVYQHEILLEFEDYEEKLNKTLIL